MSDAGVEVEGWSAAVDGIARWADQLAGVVDKAGLPLVERAASSARQRVPRLSGQLAGSIGADVGDDGVELSMGDGVPYAGWIEFGGSRGRPYVPDGRYLYPTALTFADEWLNVAEAAADDSIGRFSWSTPSG